MDIQRIIILPYYTDCVYLILDTVQQIGLSVLSFTDKTSRR